MKRTLILSLYVAMALTVAIISGYLVVAFMVQKAPEVKVPDVTDLTLSDALDRLQEAKLDLEVRDFAYSDLVKENRVVTQRPQPGAIIKEGRAVGVVLSRGNRRSSVPEVRGKRVEEAAMLISEAGLKYEIGASIPGGRADEVIGMNREPGAKLGGGEVVKFIVSSGPKAVTLRMPRVEGMTRGEAEGLLGSIGLSVERIEMVNLGDPEKAGKIISQEPLPGYPVERGASVTLAAAAVARR